MPASPLPAHSPFFRIEFFLRLANCGVAHPHHLIGQAVGLALEGVTRLTDLALGLNPGRLYSGDRVVPDGVGSGFSGSRDRRFRPRLGGRAAAMAAFRGEHFGSLLHI